MGAQTARRGIMEIELNTLIDQFETFLDATDQARADSELCRDYKDHKQWTEDEVAKLEARGQAAIVNNRIAPKVKYMVGEQQKRRRKPKAYPRTPEHENTADAITDALRYVCDNNDFKHISSRVYENEVVEGYGGVIVEVEDKNGEPEIVHNYIPWDRYYYDPHSRNPDFSDKKYDGVVLWLDESDVKQMFPSKSEDIDTLMSMSTEHAEETTFEDKPLWIDRKRRRIKVCQHYFKHKNVWHVAYFTGHVYLIEPKPSPYLDEDGNPQNPIEAQSSYIDRDNNRYGEVKGYIDLQNEINHRHSKYLHLLSTRQTWSTPDVVKDIQKLKTELSKPNGHLEFEHGEFGKDFGVLPTTDMAIGQFNLLQEAKSSIDAISVNAAMDGTEERNLSGRALIAKQQGGLTEIGPTYDSHRSWELRVYRQTWNRIKQFWGKEKWIRVTDDEKKLRWVGLNHPMTYRELLQEKLEDKETPPEIKQQSMVLINSKDPRLDQQAEVRNYIPEIDVDIIIEDGPDAINVQQEQFQTLAVLAQSYGPEKVPFEAMLKLSQIPNKDEVEDLLKGDISPEQQALAQRGAQLREAQVVADIEKKQSEVNKNNALAFKAESEGKVKQIETVTAMQEKNKPPVKGANQGPDGKWYANIDGEMYRVDQ